MGISAVLKTELRERIHVIQNKAFESKKRALQQRVDSVVNSLKEQVALAAADGRKVLTLNVDIGADSKASQKVMNAVKSVAPDMAFMGISEEEAGSGGKLMAFAIVPEAMIESDLKANEWIQATLAVCG